MPVPLAPPPKEGVGYKGVAVALRLTKAVGDTEVVEMGVKLPPPSVEGEDEGQTVGVTRPEALAPAPAPAPTPPPLLGVGEGVFSAGVGVLGALGVLKA